MPEKIVKNMQRFTKIIFVYKFGNLFLGFSKLGEDFFVGGGFFICFYIFSL